MLESVSKKLWAHQWKNWLDQLRSFTAQIFDRKLLQKQFRKDIPLLLASSFVIHFLSLALSIFLLQVYDRIIPNEGIGSLFVLFSGVAIALFLEVILKALRDYFTSWNGVVFEHETMRQMMRRLLLSKALEAEKVNPSDYMKRIKSVSRLRDFYSGQFFLMMLDLPFSFVYVAFIGYIGGILMLVPLILLSIFAYVTFSIGAKIRKQLIKKDAINDKITNFIFESVLSIEIIKSKALETLFCRQYESYKNQIAKANHEVAMSDNMLSISANTLSQLMTIFLVGFGSYQVLNGNMGIGGLAACMILSNRIIQPIQKFLGLWKKFQDFDITQKKVLEILELPMSIPEMYLPDREIPGTLEVKNISFKYPGMDRWIIENLSFKLSPGQSVAILGEPSCGKSTLLSLLCGLFDPVKGKILVDGVGIQHFDPHFRAKHIGHIPSLATIYRGTILDNLTFFGYHPTKDVLKAAESLKLLDVIHSLPLGLETPLNNLPNDPLPLATKQMLAICRVLAAKPKIIIFDDADMMLDKKWYNQLFTVIAKLKTKVSLIISSDDKNLISLADERYLLEKGRLNLMEEKTFLKPFLIPSRELTL